MDRYPVLGVCDTLIVKQLNLRGAIRLRNRALVDGPRFIVGGTP